MSLERAVFFSPTRCWVGDSPQEATHWAEVPLPDDPRWIPGKPDILDTQVLTLSPFYPSGRLGVCVELKSSQPFGLYPNHPPFEGARAWMMPDELERRPIDTLPMWGRDRRHAQDESPSP